MCDDWIQRFHTGIWHPNMPRSSLIVCQVCAQPAWTFAIGVWLDWGKEPPASRRQRLSTACSFPAACLRQCHCHDIYTHLPCNCEQLSVSWLSTWLHIISHNSVSIWSDTDRDVPLCFWLNWGMSGGERERESPVTWTSCFVSPATAPPPPLSLWQGFPVEFLRGPSSVSINLDVSRAGHHRPALNALPGDVS